MVAHRAAFTLIEPPKQTPRDPIQRRAIVGSGPPPHGLPTMIAVRTLEQRLDRFMSVRASSQCSMSLARLLITSALLMMVGALLVASPATAQPAINPEAASDGEPNISGQVNLRGTVGVPRGGLRSNIEGLGGGLHGYIGGWLDNRPLLIGLDVGIINYGRTASEVPFSSTVGPRVPVEVTTNNNVAEAHLSVRLQSRHGRVRPFVEGLFGFKYLFTRTSVEDAGFDDDPSDEIADQTNYDDFALSGGAGAGLDIRLYQQDSPAKTVQAVSLHLGVRYLLGQKASYLAEGALEDTNGNGRLDRSEMDVRRSRTTFLQPQFGLTLRLGGSD